VRYPRRKKDFFIFHAHGVQGFPTTSPQLPHIVFTQQIPIATGEISTIPRGGSCKKYELRRADIFSKSKIWRHGVILLLTI
jgi:hypothetical protein